MVLWFMGVEILYVSSSLLNSVSTLFVVVSFDTSEGWLREIITSLYSLVLSLFSEDVYRGGTINGVLGDG